jgi:hypothetical protein
MAVQCICRVLAPEGIAGSVLKGMTADDLRSMGISYGDARRLVDQIKLVDLQVLQIATSVLILANSNGICFKIGWETM